MITEPLGATEALAIPKWETVMEEKYQAFIHNHTWILVPQASEMSLLGNKWV